MEQLSGCRISGCQYEGRIEYMEWGSDDMTETDDSEWEDPDERANRLYVECYNFDLFEGMTPLTYTPPLRKNRRRRYEVRKKMDRKLKNQVVVLVIGGFKPCKVFTTNVIPNRSTESPSQSRSCSTIIVDMKKRVEMK